VEYLNVGNCYLVYHLKNSWRFLPLRRNLNQQFELDVAVRDLGVKSILLLPQPGFLLLQITLTPDLFPLQLNISFL
jgi:hypothetical protein